MTIKVFRLNDYEWWAAESLEEAIEACMKQTGLDEDEAVYEPDEVSDEGMDNLTVADDESPDRRRIVSFRVALDELVVKGQEFPCLFASTIR